MAGLVSVIIPVFNSENTIGETLDSVLSQTHTHWECLVIDDGSTDGTARVVNEYAARDDRIHYLQRPVTAPKGANACRNFGFKKSKGTYINWLDGDDLMEADKLARQLKLLKEKTDLVYCPWGTFTNGQSPSRINNLKSYSTFEHLKAFLDALADARGYFPIHAYLMHRELVSLAGPWDESLLINQDGEFMSRVFVVSRAFRFTASTAVYYRKAETTTSAYTSEEKASAAIDTWRTITGRLRPFGKRYCEVMKLRLYKNLKRSYPQLIRKNRIFFSAQLLRYELKKSKLYRFFSNLKNN
ncbi:MAG: glycosyltransferase family 2 protein [Flavobacteriales bacterium]|nr:glycosyltransferase family 2 protein [Flavobacteriales bacterium]